MTSIDHCGPILATLYQAERKFDAAIHKLQYPVPATREQLRPMTPAEQLGYLSAAFNQMAVSLTTQLAAGKRRFEQEQLNQISGRNQLPI